MGRMTIATLPSRRAFASGLAGLALMPAAACGQGTPSSSAPAPAVPFAPKRIDAAQLAPLVEQARLLPQLRSMIVAQDGRVLLERVFAGPSLDTPVNIKSAAKTVLAAVTGAAIDRGMVEGLDQPLGDLLGRRIPASADPRVRRITVEQLLSMSAGLEPTSGRNYGRWVSSRDWLAFALTRPFVAEPGGRMLYSTGTSHILSAALTNVSGRSTLQLARDWIGDPLGIAVPPWPRDPQGVYFGGNDMLLSPRALLRFGEMYRNDGLHRGARVLSAAWVRDSWRSRGGRSPWTGYTYGLGWWLRTLGPHPVNFAWGFGGQMVFVAPSLGITAVMTSDPSARGRDGHVQALHALFDRAIAGLAV